MKIYLDLYIAHEVKDAPYLDSITLMHKTLGTVFLDWDESDKCIDPDGRCCYRLKGIKYNIANDLANSKDVWEYANDKMNIIKECVVVEILLVSVDNTNDEKEITDYTICAPGISFVDGEERYDMEVNLTEPSTRSITVHFKVNEKVLKENTKDKENYNFADEVTKQLGQFNSNGFKVLDWGEAFDNSTKLYLAVKAPSSDYPLMLNGIVLKDRASNRILLDWGSYERCEAKDGVYYFCCTNIAYTYNTETQYWHHINNIFDTLNDCVVQDIILYADPISNPMMQLVSDYTVQDNSINITSNNRRCSIEVAKKA